MRTQDFLAGTIEQAAEEILKVLKEKTTGNVSSGDNVFYFDGWDGLGASAVLRAVARRLTTTSPAGQRDPDEAEFDQVIHIDASMWENRRALQRAVGKQLKLPDEVMELFDRQDEEDDFHGVAQGSRNELQQVVMEMFQHIQKLNRRFLVIFHNGSNEEIDLANLCGFPMSRFSTSKVLWTFQGRFRLIPRWKFDTAIKTAGTTDAFLSAAPLIDGFHSELEFWSNLVRQEASEIVEACKANTGPECSIIEQCEQVADCFLYMLELCCSGRHSNDYDLARHCATYWTCDGIIRPLQQGKRDIGGGAADGGDNDVDVLWRAADALQREMRLDVDYHQDPPLHLAMCAERKPYWTSPTLGCILVPTGATPNRDMFQHYADKLSVLKLSRCTFNFQSPPFLCCHNLRFLWLDRCQGSDMIGTNGAGKEEDIRRFFQRLWVLDVRYTDCDQILSAQMLDLMSQLRVLNVMAAWWDISQLKGRLPNIHELRVTKSVLSCSGLENELFSEMNKMELLDFSENCTISPKMSLSRLGVRNNISVLETVIIIDGCDGYGIEQISFRGCNKLKNIFLRGRMLHLHTLDISGTAVKILDLTSTAIESLDELYLLGCEKLCAILWPPQDEMKPDLAKFCIDTTLSAPTAQSREGQAKRGTSTATARTSTAAAGLHGSGLTSKFNWYISVRDARLLMSLEPVYSSSRKAYVEVSSISIGGSKYKGHKSGGGSSGQRVLVNLQQHVPAIYIDITVDHLQQQGSEGADDAPGIMRMWPCPDAPHLEEKSCYMHIHDDDDDEMRTGLLGGEETKTITVPNFVIDCGQILHVHDSLSITTLPLGPNSLGSEWHMLEWCRIERCPRLNCVFTPGGKRDGGFLYGLRTVWVSQLPKARYIWKWSEPGLFRTLPELTLLHLDCCPRLIHVLPLSKEVIDSTRPSLNKLETLEITWCADLREVFPLDTEAMRYLEQKRQPVTLDFPSLKHIHLHELPSLQRIFGFRVRMSTPNLKTIKIRGCWSLTRLPDVSRSNKVVECDCEKEWWDSLQWDNGSLARRYKPIHSRYYKKTLLRSSVLR